MFRKKHDNPDGDDMLVAIRRDGNVIIDPRDTARIRHGAVRPLQHGDPQR